LILQPVWCIAELWLRPLGATVGVPALLAPPRGCSSSRSCRRTLNNSWFIELFSTRFGESTLERDYRYGGVYHDDIRSACRWAYQLNPHPPKHSNITCFIIVALVPDRVVEYLSCRRMISNAIARPERHHIPRFTKAITVGPWACGIGA